MAIVCAETGLIEFEGLVVETFERNGYDDSDYAAVVWHGDHAETVWYASTRYVSTRRATRDAPPEVLAAYRDHLAAKSVAEVVAADTRRVAEPQPSDLTVGARVTWTRDTKFQGKAVAPCDRCQGEGCWVNPRNPGDRRPCFGCGGSGQNTGEKLKTETGKPVWSKIAAGATGEVLSWRSFGRFYRNGYNRPGRENTTVQVRLDDGRVVPASLDALALAREPISAEEALVKLRR